jgi:hypothetical protein
MEGRSGDSFSCGAVLTCNRAGVWEFKQLAPHDPGPAVWADAALGTCGDGPIPSLEAEPLDGLVLGLGVGLGVGAQPDPW